MQTNNGLSFGTVIHVLLEPAAATLGMAEEDLLGLRSVFELTIWLKKDTKDQLTYKKQSPC